MDPILNESEQKVHRKKIRQGPIMHKDSDDSGNDEEKSQEVKQINKEVFVDQLTPTQSIFFEYIEFYQKLLK